jgi:hypothetical protein
VRHPAVAAESSVEEILSAIGLNYEDSVTVLCAASAADTRDAVQNITGAQVHSDFAHYLSGCATDNEFLMPWKLHFCRWMQSPARLQTLVCLRGTWASCCASVLSSLHAAQIPHAGG